MMMKMFNVFLLMTLVVCAYMVEGEEETRTAAMVTLLSRRLDRTALDLVSLEGRVQSQFEELKTMIGNIGSAKQDESIKDDMESNIKPLIESFIRTQTSTVYKAFAAEKKALRQMKTGIETRVTNVESQTKNDIWTFQHYANMKHISLANTQQQQQQSINTAFSSISGLQNKFSNLGRALSNMGIHASFSTELNTHLPSISKNTKIVFDSVMQNEGGHYDKSTGVFTAPASGVYLFLYNVASYTGKKAHVELVVDGDRKTEAIARSGDTPNVNGGNAGILQLKKRNRVWIQTAYLDNTYAIWPWRTAFHGVLLYTTV